MTSSWTVIAAGPAGLATAVDGASEKIKASRETPRSPRNVGSLAMGQSRSSATPSCSAPTREMRARKRGHFSPHFPPVAAPLSPNVRLVKGTVAVTVVRVTAVTVSDTVKNPGGSTASSAQPINRRILLPERYLALGCRQSGEPLGNGPAIGRDGDGTASKTRPQSGSRHASQSVRFHRRLFR